MPRLVKIFFSLIKEKEKIRKAMCLCAGCSSIMFAIVLVSFFETPTATNLILLGIAMLLLGQYKMED